MDIQTKDGILLRGIPDGTPDEVIKARIAKIRAESGTPSPSQPAAPQGLWETIKQAAKPDIFNAGDAGYELGGKVVDATGSPALGTAINVASQAIPMLAGGVGGAATATPAMGWGAKRLMQSAIKPAIGDMERGKVAPAIQTMLEQGYSPTNAGVAAMKDKAGGFLDKADEIIDSSKKLVNVEKADQYLRALAERLKVGTKGASKVDDVAAASQELRAHSAVDDLGLISVKDAQAMKQANYKDIGPNAYGLDVKQQTARDALKAQTAALRKGIEEAEPSVAPLNAKAGELLNAAKVSQRRALMEGNKDLLPIGAGLATAVHNPAVTLGMYANSSAYIKSLLARLLYNTKEVPPVAGAALAAQLGNREQQ